MYRRLFFLHQFDCKSPIGPLGAHEAFSLSALHPDSSSSSWGSTFCSWMRGFVWQRPEPRLKVSLARVTHGPRYHLRREQQPFFCYRGGKHEESRSQFLSEYKESGVAVRCLDVEAEKKETSVWDFHICFAWAATVSQTSQSIVIQNEYVNVYR